MQISSSSNGASRSKRWLTLTLRSTFSTWLHGLRQMFLDGDSLVHQANREHRLKLAFVVGEFRSAPDGWVTIASLEDGLDPDTRPPGSPSKEANLDGFMGHVVLYLKGHGYSDRDIMKRPSDAAGGAQRTTSPQGPAQSIPESSAVFGVS